MADESQASGQLAAILLAVERQTSRAEVLEAKLDTIKSETERFGNAQETFNRRLEKDFELLRNSVHALGRRVSVAETTIDRLHAADGEIVREQSAGDLRAHAEIGRTLAHLSELATHVEELRDHGARRDRVDEALCRELELDYDGIAKGEKNSMPPVGPERKDRVRAAKSRRSKLNRLARENRSTLGASLAAALLVALQIAFELLKQH